MMRTLLGHQVRTTTRPLASATGMLVLVLLVSLIPAVLRLGALGTFGQSIAVVAVLAILPVVLVLLAVDYWRTMYGPEGYFTMTLPVRGRVLFAARTVHALVVAALAAVVTVGGAALILVARARQERVAVGDAWQALWSEFQGAPGVLVWALAAILVGQVVATVIQVAAVLSISAEGRFQSLGWGAPMIGLVLLYLATQVVNGVGMLWVPLGIRLTGPDAGTLVARGMWSDIVQALTTGADPEVLGLGSVVTGAALTVAVAVWSVRSIERHTSLR